MGLFCHLFGHKYGEGDVCSRCGTSRGSEGLQYKRTADKSGYAVVGTGKCQDEAVAVPRLYKKKPVKEIGARAFAHRDLAYSIVLPDTVERIGRGAFQHSALLAITFSDAPCALEAEAFRGCARLTEAALPRDIDSVPALAFADCTALTEVHLPPCVTAVGDAAFAGCAALRVFDYANPSLSLGSSAFRGCTALEAIRLPDGMSELPPYLLTGCEALTTLDIPSSVTAVGEYALAGCLRLAAIELPESVVSVSSGAFCDCASVETFVFPDSLVAFVPNKAGEGNLFRGCSALREITLHTNFKHFPVGTFTDCISLTDVHLVGGKSLDWRAIQKDDGFDEGSGAYVVHLVNGRIRKGC